MAGDRDLSQVQRPSPRAARPFNPIDYRRCGPASGVVRQKRGSIERQALFGHREFPMIGKELIREAGKIPVGRRFDFTHLNRSGS